MKTEADVIVVGAGFAGLKAAQELVARGRSVIMLEANDRVGGRAKRGELAGRVIDPGCQWIGVHHDVLIAEGKRLGIETYPQYTAGKTILQIAGKTAEFTGTAPRLHIVALLELALVQRRWEREMKTVPAAAPWQAPRAEEWDAMTLDSWIRKHVWTKTAREFARLFPRAAWAVEARQVSYLWFLDSLRSGEGMEQLMGVEGGILDRKFKGGMQQVAQRLAEELGDRVVLGARAEKIVQDSSGVRVFTPKGEFTARHIIVAVPPGPASRIVYAPHLPAARDGLQQRMAMGNIVKVNIAYASAFWREKGYSGQIVTADDVLGVVMDDVQDTGAPTLICFIEGRHALALNGAGAEARKGKVIASLVKFFGPEAAHPLAYHDCDWSDDPSNHGYVGHMGPGVMTRYGHALREPCGRIHWASTETSTEWAGYIEGAMRSGIRAAEEVAARHNA